MSPYACEWFDCRRVLLLLVAVVAVVGTSQIHSLWADEPTAPKTQTRKPNIVLVFADDLGYGDLGCYGAKGYTTPNLDRLAAEGVRFTDFHVPAAVCSASRAALLTGCYPQRISILGALGPQAKNGINENEVLLPEILKAQGYATAIFGKWHLGHHVQFLPTRHGFDEYFGLPYSNDMWPKHPEVGSKFPPLPLIDGEKTLELNPDQTQITTWYTEHAVKFIERNKEKPFFLYVPHSMPHVPLHVSEKFKGKSERGLFGDVIEELDWSVGEIVAALKKHGLEENTLVMFTSDNGPWLPYGNHAGSQGPLREGKGTAWEGGMREPFIARWPGKIPAGKVCTELATTMDILPTVAKLAGGETPKDRVIDGHDIWPLLASEAVVKTPDKVFYHYWNMELCGVRRGQWKLMFPHTYRTQAGPPGKNGQPSGVGQAKLSEISLYNLNDDVGEAKNVAADHPDIVQELSALADEARADLGDSLTKTKGKNVRPAGMLKE